MKTKICPTCKKKFSKNYHYSNNYWTKQIYCSIQCSNTLLVKDHIPWNKGKQMARRENNPSWKGGRSITVRGYVRIYVGSGEYKLEHRLVIEQYLGRKLRRDEVIHHLNGNKQDNRLENLQVIPKKRHDQIETTKRWKENPASFNRR